VPCFDLILQPFLFFPVPQDDKFQVFSFGDTFLSRRQKGLKFSSLSEVALATQDEKVKARTAEYEKRVRYCAGRLNTMPGVTCPEPRGAFYLFPDISGTGRNDEEFAWWLLEKAKVAVIPGTAFGASGAGHVRIACTLGMDDLKKAMDRMEEALSR
jgi:aspartate/methionine/tyrosine aminotransferase